MAYANLNADIRLTDDMERKLVNRMVREESRSDLSQPVRRLGRAVLQVGQAFGAFLDAYAETVDEAGRRSSYHGRYW